MIYFALATALALVAFAVAAWPTRKPAPARADRYLLADYHARQADYFNRNFPNGD
jgi:hypothetical protein